MKKAASVFVFLLLFSACARVENSAQKQFGEDSNYFLALKKAEAGDEKEAIRLFASASKKASPLVAKKSAESLTLLGSVPQRITASVSLAQNYGDESSVLTACKELFLHEEFSKIIGFTEHISPVSSKNELVKLRLLSLAKKNDSRFETEFYTWFVSRPLSSEHLESYSTYISFLSEKNKRIQEESERFQKDLDKRSLLESQLAPQQDGHAPQNGSHAEQNNRHAEQNNRHAELVSASHNTGDSDIRQNDTSIAQNDKTVAQNGKNAKQDDTDTLFDALQSAENPQKTIMDFRIAVFHRSYKLAFGQIEKIFTIYKNLEEEVDAQILSDIGKAVLYGTNDYFASARYFDRLAPTLSREKAYFAHFYAARLYDKAGRYPKQTVSRFKSALESTDDSLQFDNTLWYLLNFQLRTSTDDIISTLTEYGSKIHDSEYFDDFFESLSILLLSSHRWQDFFKVWKHTNSNFSEYTAGKYAYISGRLIEEGLAKGDEGLKTRQAVDAFTQVLNGSSSLYYKICAMERLNVTDAGLVESYLFNKNGQDEQIDDNGAERLLKGYMAFGFPSRIYSEWIVNRKNLSTEDSIEISKFLAQCAKASKDNSYNVQALRIAARTFENTKGEIPHELFELTFPRIFGQIIENAAEEFSVPDYLVFALVRSESFFDSNVTSKAGANGLTQLMEATAADEAKKLKIGNENGDYDIFEPEANVRMGTHYLSSLISRTDENNELLALYAYNAGLTNVRNWASRFRNDWATTGKAAHKPVGISMDLFLESLPFAETREYGRKVVSAAAMYAYLYNGKLPCETVREIMY
mgnify:CR=1 FL=1